MDQQLEIGSSVVFVTTTRERVSAIVTAVHAHGEVENHRKLYDQWPCINLVFVTTDESKQDPYGRQIERASSVCHGKAQGMPQGYCWVWPDE